ncbi:hypothetical protein [Pedobacter nyackensis]|uniref:hypothetical protein n=1 Tax=Pedobacter nyackensis TaxID=475255 RepID=UPI0029318C87|nr:hypothetical protein [Pedobacter nyackensis]
MPNQTKLELLSFGDLLCTDFSPLNITTTLQTKTIDNLKQEIFIETQRIINEFKNVTCRNYEEYHLERYIQTHQREAINLMDKTSQYLQGLDQGIIGQNIYEQATTLYQSIISALENILNYIEKEQCKYFDLSVCVPDTYRIGSAELLKANLNILTAKLKSKAIDPALQQIILNYITAYCSRQSCSYKQLIYTKLIMSCLLEQLSINKDIDWDKKMMIGLIYLNFNTVTFITYCKRYIAVSVSAEPTFTTQTAKFSWYIKEIKKIHLKPNVAYKISRKPISELLLDYINLEQLHMLEVQNQSHEKQPVKDLTERVEKIDFKLPLNLSVEQLGLFTELFMRAKILLIEKGKIMTTMNFFSQHVTTIGTDQISALSLNKSRRPNVRTTQWMKEMLKTMHKVLDDIEAE